MRGQWWLLATVPLITAIVLVANGASSEQTGVQDQAVSDLAKTVGHARSDFAVSGSYEFGEPTNDNRGVVWLSTGGRVGDGLIGIYNQDGKLVRSISTGPLRDVQVVDGWLEQSVIVIREVAASGTGQHAEQIRVVQPMELDRSLWSQVVREELLGPYPRAQRMGSVVSIDRTTETPRLLFVRRAQKGKQTDRGIAWEPVSCSIDIFEWDRNHRRFSTTNEKDVRVLYVTDDSNAEL